LKKLPQTENPAWSNLICTFKSATNPTEYLDTAKCIKDRQEASEIKQTCEKVQKLQTGTVAYDNCVAVEKDKKKKAIQISGTSDPTIKEPTKIDLEIQIQEKSIFIKKGDITRLRFPAELKIANPQKRKLSAKVSCTFEKSGKKIAGQMEIPNAQKTPTQTLTDLDKEEIEKNLICVPVGTLEAGSYSLTYTVEVNNLESKSRLTRAFIGDKNGTERKNLISKLKSTYPDLTKGSRSAKDPAWINFALGEPPSDPIIEKDDYTMLRVDVKKNVLGDILKIRSYKVDLTPIASQDCFEEKREIELNKLLPTPGKNSVSSIPLASCFIKSLPLELKTPTDFVIKEFEASIVYDYQIEKKTNIRIEFIEDVKTS